MNFIALTDRFARQLEAWKAGHGFSDKEALKDLTDIWDEFKNIPERKLVIYGSLKTQPPKTDISCGNCVVDLLNFCYNWRKLLVNEVTVDFKGVPQATVLTNEPELASLYEMKMPEIRQKAKLAGIKFSNTTTKSELIKELNAKTQLHTQATPAQ